MLCDCIPTPKFISTVLSEALWSLIHFHLKCDKLLMISFSFVMNNIGVLRSINIFIVLLKWDTKPLKIKHPSQVSVNICPAMGEKASVFEVGEREIY